MMLKAASILLLHYLQVGSAFAKSKCGTGLYQACIGEGDPRYDTDVSANLEDIHPIFGKYHGYWLCQFKDFDGNTQPKTTNYVPANDEARRTHKNRPYDLTDVPAFMNVTVDGTRLYLHELRIYSPAPADWCAGTPDDKHTNVMDDGECGVNGWAEGGDAVRTSTHDKDEYAITAKSSGILSGGEAPDEHEGHDDHLRRALLNGQPDHLRKTLLRGLQDDREGHGEGGGGHGHGGGGVEHPLHGVDNVLFAADSSSGVALHYAVKTFNEDFDSFTMRSGSFDLMTSAEIGTSQYSCTRATSTEFETATSNAYDTAQVTPATRELLSLADHGCLVPPCATEEELCETDPSCSVSPYQEQETMKTGAIVGFCVLGAVVAIAMVVFVYQKRMQKANHDAKAKFATRLRESTFFTDADNANETEKRAILIKKFDKVDTDKSGLVNKEELWTYIHDGENPNMTKSEYDTLFKLIDSDGSGEIDFAEFSSFMSKLHDTHSQN